MPAKTEKQRKAMAIAEHESEKLYEKNKHLASLTKKQLHDFAMKKKSRKSRHGSGPFLTEDMQRGYKRV